MEFSSGLWTRGISGPLYDAGVVLMVVVLVAEVEVEVGLLVSSVACFSLCEGGDTEAAFLRFEAVSLSVG